MQRFSERGVCISPPWWDERAALQAAATSAQPRLLAHVDLDCAYLRAVVLESLARRPAWRVVVPAAPGDAEECSCPAAAAFSWAEYERLDWSRVLAGQLHASAYCVRKGLIRKSQFAYHVKKWAAKHPDGLLAGGVPETHLLEFWDAEYIEEALADVYEVRDMKTDGSEWWILKPRCAREPSCGALRLLTRRVVQHDEPGARHPRVQPVGIVAGGATRGGC